MDKKYLNVDEQIQLLKSKKLKIDSEKKAKRSLRLIGYYKLINAYKIPFIHLIDGKKEYRENVTFEEIYFLYEFDRKLKTIVFEASTNIEINIKSYISEIISKKYGVKYKSYLAQSNFKNDDKLTTPFKEIKRQIDDSLKKQIDNNNPSIIWYKEKYNNFPFWVVANILTFGTISKLFEKMKTHDQIDVAKNYKLPYDYLEAYLIHINMIRNICAHNSVLYRYKSKNSLPQKVSQVKDVYETLGIEKDSKTGRYSRGINDLLGTIIIFKLLLSKEDYNLFKTQLLGLLTKLKRKVDSDSFKIIMKEMGLSDNCQEILSLDSIKNYID